MGERDWAEIGNGGRLYRLDVPGEAYAVADEGGWLPGIYATPQAAERALRIARIDIAALELLARQGCPIVLNDLDLLVDPYGR